jgi:hypothetical protein
VVTIGGVTAVPRPSEFVLEVEVPPGTVSGPLCVSVSGQTVCGEDFTVLPGPVLHAVSPNPVRAGVDTVLTVFGEGIIESSVVLLDGLPLEHRASEYASIEALLPEGLEPGVHLLSVKNGLRCGPESLPIPLTVD